MALLERGIEIDSDEFGTESGNNTITYSGETPEADERNKHQMSAKKVKWSISGDEPDDLPDYRSNDEIGLPPVGIYTFEIDRVQLAGVVQRQGGDVAIASKVDRTHQFFHRVRNIGSNRS